MANKRKNFSPEEKARLLNEIRNGLNCSPFEAEAVLDVVKEVYFPFLDEQSVKAPPGKVTLIAVNADSLSLHKQIAIFPYYKLLPLFASYICSGFEVLPQGGGGCSGLSVRSAGAKFAL